jgi:hypothetical protein
VLVQAQGHLGGVGEGCGGVWGGLDTAQDHAPESAYPHPQVLGCAAEAAASELPQQGVLCVLGVAGPGADTREGLGEHLPTAATPEPPGPDPQVHRLVRTPGV